MTKSPESQTGKPPGCVHEVIGRGKRLIDDEDDDDQKKPDRKKVLSKSNEEIYCPVCPVKDGIIRELIEWASFLESRL